VRQLTSLDTQFIAMEDGRAHGHVSGLGIYDPSTVPHGDLTAQRLRTTIAERLHLLPPFRWRLERVPLDLDYPYWVDEADVDLGYHVRELALPEPGGPGMLAEQAARLISQPLDRSRPLWELYLIHGLPEGRKAILTKVHHAALDGASGAEIFGVLFDLSPGGGPPAPAAPSGSAVGEAAPGRLGMLWRGVAGMPRQPLRVLRTVPRALPHLDAVPTLRAIPGVATLAPLGRRAARALPGSSGRETAADRPVHAPRTALNGRISAHRRAAFSRVSLDEVKAVKDHFGVKVNDVVVAICAGALRDWLGRRDQLPAEPLVALIPVSVRTPEEAGTFGNRASTMLVPIPTDEPDPRRRLLRAHEELRDAKARHREAPRMILQDANHLIPPPALAGAARALGRAATGRLGEAPLNVIVSNVPGSPLPLHFAGARQEAMYPLSAIMDGAGLNLTVMSYAGGLDIGIVADRELAEDLFPLADAVRAAHAELVALLPRPRRERRATPERSAPARRAERADSPAGAR